MAPRKSSGCCFVPGCDHVRKLIPEKLFFPVPQGDMRRKWCEVAGRPIASLTLNEWCCEDHFELEDDVQDWMRYKVLKEAGLKTFRLRLKPNVLPHIFTCQPSRKTPSPCTHSKLHKNAAVQKQKAEIIDGLLKQIKDEEPTLCLKREVVQPDNQPECIEVNQVPANLVHEQLVDFDYQDSLWAPYCDGALEEDSSTVDFESIDDSRTIVDDESVDLTDGTYFVLQVDPSSGTTYLQTEEEASAGIFHDTDTDGLEFDQSTKTKISESTETEAKSLLSDGESSSNFWNWKVLECKESDEKDDGCS